MYTVDVAAYQADIGNGKFVETSSFRDYPAYESMVVFNLRFLPGSLWVTEKYVGTDQPGSGMLKGVGILKFNTIIREYHRE